MKFARFVDSSSINEAAQMFAKHEISIDETTLNLSAARLNLFF